MERYDYFRHSPLRQTISESRRFADQPLQSSAAFRILKLLRGTHDEPIECNLEVRGLTSENIKADSRNRLKDPEPYDALSYEWGSQEGECYVKVLAGSEASRIPIGTNLDDALRQLRFKNESRFLWVDALCINQRDKDEKSAQIPLMRLIYNRADCVRVWLGKAANGSEMAMKFVRRCSDMEAFDRLVGESLASQEWAALSSLMRRPWFSRRWIIQEIALAKRAEVHCGSEIIPWREFASVISMLDRRQPQLKQLFRESRLHGHHPDYLGDLSELGATRLADMSTNLCSKLEDGTITERLLSLEGLISSLTAFAASDPHDVLYAILWLANDAHPVTKEAYHLPTSSIQPSTPYILAQSPLDIPSPLSTMSRRPSSVETFPDYQPTLLTPGQPSSRRRARSDISSRSSYSGLNVDEVPIVPTIQEPIDPLSGMSPNLSRPPSSAGETKSSVRSSAPLCAPEADATGVEAPTVDHSGFAESSTSIIADRKRRLRPRLSISTVSGVDKEKVAGALFMACLESSRIVVDYNKSIFEVCKDFVEFSLKRSSSLDMLCKPWAPITEANEAPLPTWIPQLSGSAFAPTVNGIHRRVNADSLVGQPGFPTGAPKRYRASRKLPAEWRFGESSQSLIVKGFVLDKIKERKAQAASGTIPTEWMEAVNWKQTSQPPPDLLWRTLVGNRDEHGKLPPPYWQTSCRDAFRLRPWGAALNTQDVMFSCPSLVEEFLNRVQRVVWNRRLVLLEKLSRADNPVALALAPSTAKKGDLVCILYGCSVPVILREMVNGEPAAKRRKCEHPSCPSNGKEGPAYRVSGSPEKIETYYKLIGECYVHGMMDGEAFSVKQDGTKNHTVQFDLR